VSKSNGTPITANIAQGTTPQYPEPEMLSRGDNTAKDAEKRWNIVNVQPKRGEPATEVTLREMRVPMYDTEHSRVIRAHEMTHAKVSPTAKQFEKWVARGYAKAPTLVVCEELRVNVLCSYAGFEPTTHLSDGSEYLAGKRTAEVGDFLSCVMDAIAFRGTAGYEQYLRGVAQHEPSWVKLLETISHTGENYFRSVMDNQRSTPSLHATHSRLHLSGFGYVENYAKWVEEQVGALCDNPTGKPQPQKEGEGKEGEGAPSGEVKDEDGKSPTEKASENFTHDRWGRGTIPKKGRATLWEELRISTPALERNVMGAIGRKRVSSQTGRNPRRMSRLLTDPERRIFDRTVKGAGGVVLIDTSGSMSLEHDEVMEMVLSAPSALVAQYSGGRSSRPNLYVVANKGKCVKELPSPNGGNGVDAPALRWAIGKRQRNTSPVIWVTDGGVTGKGDSWGEDLVMECVALIKRHGIYTCETPEQAVTMLKAMSKGEKVKSIVPSHMKGVYESVTGHELTYR
jgi:hypothetical protein